MAKPVLIVVCLVVSTDVAISAPYQSWLNLECECGKIKSMVKIHSHHSFMA